MLDRVWNNSLSGWVCSRCIELKSSPQKLECLYLVSIGRVSSQHQLSAEYALRYLMVMLTFSLAAAIPKLDLFISLVSATNR